MLQSAGGRQCARAEGLLGLPCINHRGSYWAYVEQAIQLARLASWPPKTETGLPLHCLPNAAKYVVQGSRIPVLPLPRAAAVRRSFRFICAFQKGSQLCCLCCPCSAGWPWQLLFESIKQRNGSSTFRIPFNTLICCLRPLSSHPPPFLSYLQQRIQPLCAGIHVVRLQSGLIEYCAAIARCFGRDIVFRFLKIRMLALKH